MANLKPNDLNAFFTKWLDFIVFFSLNIYILHTYKMGLKYQISRNLTFLSNHILTFIFPNNIIKVTDSYQFFTALLHMQYFLISVSIGYWWLIFWKLSINVLQKLKWRSASNSGRQTFVAVLSSINLFICSNKFATVDTDII